MCEVCNHSYVLHQGQEGRGYCVHLHCDCKESHARACSMKVGAPAEYVGEDVVVERVYGGSIYKT